MSGRVNFPIRHSRYIAIPPLVAKYHHEWGKKFTTSGIHHEWRSHSWWIFFPIRGDILPLVVELRCTFRDSWGNFFSPTRGFATRGGKNPTTHPVLRGIVHTCHLYSTYYFSLRNFQQFVKHHKKEFMTGIEIVHWFFVCTHKFNDNSFTIMYFSLKIMQYLHSLIQYLKPSSWLIG